MQKKQAYGWNDYKRHYGLGVDTIFVEPFRRLKRWADNTISGYAREKGKISGAEAAEEAKKKLEKTTPEQVNKAVDEGFRAVGNKLKEYTPNMLSSLGGGFGGGVLGYMLAKPFTKSRALRTQSMIAGAGLGGLGGWHAYNKLVKGASMNNDSINNNKGDTKMNYKTVYSGYMCKQAEDSVKGASTEPASSETAYRQPDADPNKKYRYQLDNIAITSTKPMSLQDQAAVVNIADRRDAKVRNSINYLAALFALGGAGVLSKADKSEAASRVGGGMLGASLGGAAGYHGMRLAGYTRGPQLLAALLGALGGGVAGGLGTPKVIE